MLHPARYGPPGAPTAGCGDDRAVFPSSPLAGPGSVAAMVTDRSRLAVPAEAVLLPPSAHWRWVEVGTSEREQSGRVDIREAQQCSKSGPLRLRELAIHSACRPGRERASSRRSSATAFPVTCCGRPATQQRHAAGYG